MTRTRGGNFQQTDLCRFFQAQARLDDAGLYQCAKGVANLLAAAGLPYTRGDGHTWKDSLPKNGWVRLEGFNPQNAPPGAVIAYDRDPPSIRKNNGAGSEFGHVEIVAMGEDGKRRYVSDTTRTNPGGTVPHNFAGVFWHPSMGPLPTPGSDNTYAGTAPSAVLARQQQGSDRTPAGARDTADTGGGPARDTTTAGTFNDASGNSKYSILMVMLAMAVLSSAMTGNKPEPDAPAVTRPPGS